MRALTLAGVLLVELAACGGVATPAPSDAGHVAAPLPDLDAGEAADLGVPALPDAAAEDATPDGADLDAADECIPSPTHVVPCLAVDP